MEILPEIFNKAMDAAHTNINILKTKHEYSPPAQTSKEAEESGTPNGGITGNIRFKGLQSIFFILNFVCPVPYRLNKESIFFDLGSGRGIPNFVAGTLPIRASIGCDIVKEHVYYANVNKYTLELRTSCINFVIQDADLLRSLPGVTHLYCFLGYSGMITNLMRICIHTPSIKTLIVIPVHYHDIYNKRMLTKQTESDVLRTCVKMPSGSGHTAFIILLTNQRIDDFKEALGEYDYEHTQSIDCDQVTKDFNEFKIHGNEDISLSKKRKRKNINYKE